MIGLWDTAARLYVGYDFQGAQATDQSERHVGTVYCWQQGKAASFISLAFPRGGATYVQQQYPRGGEVVSSWFHLVIDTDLPATEDPNERFQKRLFARYADVLPAVPARNDLTWIPGGRRLGDFRASTGLGLWGPGSWTTIYFPDTLLLQSGDAHLEMPIDAAVGLLLFRLRGFVKPGNEANHGGGWSENDRGRVVHCCFPPILFMVVFIQYQNPFAPYERGHPVAGGRRTRRRHRRRTIAAAGLPRTPRPGSASAGS